MELGGAWAMRKSTYPILLPPLSRDQAIKSIGNVHMGDLNAPDEIDGIFNELSDRLEADVGIRMTASAWAEAVADFKLSYEAALERVTSTSTDESAKQRPNVVSDESDEVQLGNISIVGRDMHGEATNTDSVAYSMVSITATFYSADGTISGTDLALLSDLKPGRTRTFTLHNVPRHQSYKLDTELY
jgi:hypothetical protein